MLYPIRNEEENLIGRYLWWTRGRVVYFEGRKTISNKN